MEYSYKLLSRGDVPLLKNLLKVFGEAFGEPGTYGDAIPRDSYLESLLENINFIALAAMNGEEVVGGLAAYVFEKF